MDELAVKVYFECRGTSELVAVMSEDIYEQIHEQLAEIAEREGCTLVESIDD